MNQEFKQALKKSVMPLWKILPIILGVILLVSLANTLIPKQAYTTLFTGSNIFDPLIGSSLGSILAGNPVTSYILGGEMLAQGVSLLAVTAFIVAWVTVGLVQLPAESVLLGKKFAITRNIIAFLFSILTAIITVGIMAIL